MRYEDSKYFWTLEMLYYTFFLIHGLFLIRDSINFKEYQFIIVGLGLLFINEGIKIISISPDFKIKNKNKVKK